MTRYICTKETAVMLRAALKAAFPGVKFSVRKGTGTGSAWLSVSWIDGPTDAAVTVLTNRYEGSSWNLNNDDSYTRNPDVLMAFGGAELPEEIHFSCSGINTHRDMSDDAEKTMTTLISTALNGREFRRENMEGLEVNGNSIHGIYDIRGAIWQVFSGTDLSKISA